MEPFYAYIVPVTSGVAPTPPIYYPPVFPAHPIAPGGGASPMPPIYNPPVFPAHPIAPGGGASPMPPIYYPPVFPAHPIVAPPTGSVAPPISVPPAPAPPGYDWVQSFVPGEGHWEWTLVPEEEGGRPAHPIAPGGPNVPPAVPGKK